MQLFIQKVQAAKAEYLSPITLVLSQGLHILSGKNGSGKSTLLKLVSGVIPLASGNISLVKHGVEYISPSYKSRIGYAPQEIAVYDEMRAVHYLRYVGRMKLIPEDLLEGRIEQVITELNINTWCSSNIGQLSMGQKRMLLFAQSILADPDILLLDETLEALDIEQQSHLLGILHKSAKHSIILVASHRKEQWTDHATQFIEL
ncbi:ATP-binding cassette domain-containing protein [Paenibacillus psychroresistens]|uniref:ATP-binding cassette domain-containing protein n=1 Tax=Paenibacillus psychroresistens TaxID=1778678 RepID=UPI001390FEFA|nr:ATP-binding cassette domain-containing protein [Paenibacillus psychroresistens]